MSEINNRKRKRSPEKMTSAMQADTCDAQSTIENEPPHGNEDLNKTSTTGLNSETTQLNTKPAFKFNFDEPWKASRALLSKTAHSIGKQASKRILHNLHIGQYPSAQALNEDGNQDTLNKVPSSMDADKTQQQPEANQLSQKRKRTVQKYYTLKLRKLKEKFVTKRQLRKDRFRSLQHADPNKRFRKDLDQSRIETMKQAKLLQKLVEKHNKHLESF